jgi:hypothetical protein
VLGKRPGLVVPGSSDSSTRIPYHPRGWGLPTGEGAVLNSLQLVYDVCGLGARLWRVTRRGGRRRVSEVALTVERSRRAAS